jgi:hypothetical protein
MFLSLRSIIGLGLNSRPSPKPLNPQSPGISLLLGFHAITPNLVRTLFSAPKRRIHLNKLHIVQRVFLVSNLPPKRQLIKKKWSRRANSRFFFLMCSFFAGWFDAACVCSCFIAFRLRPPVTNNFKAKLLGLLKNS